MHFLEQLATSESILHLSAMFCKEYCRLLKLPTSSTLLTSVRASSPAFAPLLKAKTIMDQTQSGEWCNMEKLPIELKLGQSFAFHTIFSCPVSKELSTAENPPFILPCGHVVSKRSIQELDAVLSRPKYDLQFTRET